MIRNILCQKQMIFFFTTCQKLNFRKLNYEVKFKINTIPFNQEKITVTRLVKTKEFDFPKQSKLFANRLNRKEIKQQCKVQK